MQELSLRQIQLIGLDILKDIHRFCIDNNLSYSLAYGTLIGAIRHKGFIPWDDDIDIVMPRPDFDLFCRNFKSDSFRLVYYGNDKSAIATYARVCDFKQSLFSTECPWTVQDSGVWIVVFPLDGVMNMNEYTRRYSVLSSMSYLLFKFRRQNHHITDRDTFMSKLKTIIARIVGLNGLIPRFLQKMIVRIMTRYDYNQCLYVGQMSCLDDGPVILKKKLFEEIVPIQFEGCSFLAVKDFHALLSPFYGDYMQLPPEKDRIPKMNNWIHFYRK